MAKAIFVTKPNPTYDDLPEVRYHFPSTYLNQARSTIGDHIIYYEPRRLSADDSSRGGRQAYFATAQIESIIPDPNMPDHYYALIAPGTFLEFTHPVPFREGNDYYYESALQKDDGSTNRGAAGRPVRQIPEEEFDSILKAGFATVLNGASDEISEMNEGFEEMEVSFDRPLIELTITRPFREQAFKRRIRAAYENQCALTGLQLINGGGRPEVHAAHIMPVASKGPDSIRNGLALSGTFHWLFDRGLVSISDDYEILVADKLVPEPALRMLNPDRQIRRPNDPALWPHPHYLRFHRENIFKG